MAESIEEGSLTIAHQDGPLLYRLKSGGYSREGGKLTISIDTEATDDEQFPPCAMLCSENHPIEAAFRVGDRFEACRTLDDMWGDEIVGPMAYGYFTFHAEEIAISWVVREVKGGEVVFEVVAEHDDVNYYDDRAESTPTRGLFRLSEKPRSELWVPS